MESVADTVIRGAHACARLEKGDGATNREAPRAGPRQYGDVARCAARARHRSPARAPSPAASFLHGGDGGNAPSLPPSLTRSDQAGGGPTAGRGEGEGRGAGLPLGAAPPSSSTSSASSLGRSLPGGPGGGGLGGGGGVGGDLILVPLYRGPGGSNDGPKTSGPGATPAGRPLTRSSARGPPLRPAAGRRPRSPSAPAAPGLGRLLPPRPPPPLLAGGGVGGPGAAGAAKRAAGPGTPGGRETWTGTGGVGTTGAAAGVGAGQP